MADPIRIRAQLAGDQTVVRVLMTHPMASGLRTDEAGQPVPAHFITEIHATHNGRPVLSAEWGPSVSRDPFLQFILLGARVGDRVGLSWKDNLGESRSDEALVSARPQ